MRKARFSEEQITYALKQVESGKPVGEVCRQLGVSEQSFYRWKRKYQGIGSPSSAAFASWRMRTGS